VQPVNIYSEQNWFAPFVCFSIVFVIFKTRSQNLSGGNLFHTLFSTLLWIMF
jgi:hypothetical protein